MLYGNSNKYKILISYFLITLLFINVAFAKPFDVINSAPIVGLDGNVIKNIKLNVNVLTDYTGDKLNNVNSKFADFQSFMATNNVDVKLNIIDGNNINTINNNIYCLNTSLVKSIDGYTNILIHVSDGTGNDFNKTFGEYFSFGNLNIDFLKYIVTNNFSVYSITPGVNFDYILPNSQQELSINDLVNNTTIDGIKYNSSDSDSLTQLDALIEYLKSKYENKVIPLSNTGDRDLKNIDLVIMTDYQNSKYAKLESDVEKMKKDLLPYNIKINSEILTDTDVLRQYPKVSAKGYTVDVYETGGLDMWGSLKRHEVKIVNGKVYMSLGYFVSELTSQFDYKHYTDYNLVRDINNAIQVKFLSEFKIEVLDVQGNIYTVQFYDKDHKKYDIEKLDLSILKDKEKFIKMSICKGNPMLLTNKGRIIVYDNGSPKVLKNFDGINVKVRDISDSIVVDVEGNAYFHGTQHYYYEYYDGTSWRNEETKQYYDFQKLEANADTIIDSSSYDYGYYIGQAGSNLIKTKDNKVKTISIQQSFSWNTPVGSLSLKDISINSNTYDLNTGTTGYFFNKETGKINSFQVENRYGNIYYNLDKSFSGDDVKFICNYTNIAEGRYYNQNVCVPVVKMDGTTSYADADLPYNTVGTNIMDVESVEKVSLTPNSDRYFIYLSDGINNDFTKPYGEYYSFGNINKTFANYLSANNFNIYVSGDQSVKDYKLPNNPNQELTLNDLLKYSTAEGKYFDLGKIDEVFSNIKLKYINQNIENINSANVNNINCVFLTDYTGDKYTALQSKINEFKNSAYSNNLNVSNTIINNKVDSDVLGNFNYKITNSDNGEELNNWYQDIRGAYASDTCTRFGYNLETDYNDNTSKYIYRTMEKFDYPIKYNGLEDICMITREFEAQRRYKFALKTDGTVWEFLYNNGFNYNNVEVKQIESLNNIVQIISYSNDNLYALDNRGRIWVYGMDVLNLKEGKVYPVDNDLYSDYDDIQKNAIMLSSTKFKIYLNKDVKSYVKVDNGIIVLYNNGKVIYYGDKFIVKHNKIRVREYDEDRDRYYWTYEGKTIYSDGNAPYNLNDYLNIGYVDEIYSLTNGSVSSKIYFKTSDKIIHQWDCYLSTADMTISDVITYDKTSNVESIPDGATYLNNKDYPCLALYNIRNSYVNIQNAIDITDTVLNNVNMDSDEKIIWIMNNINGYDRRDDYITEFKLFKYFWVMTNKRCLLKITDEIKNYSNSYWSKPINDNYVKQSINYNTNYNNYNICPMDMYYKRIYDSKPGDINIDGSYYRKIPISASYEGNNVDYVDINSIMKLNVDSKADNYFFYISDGEGNDFLKPFGQHYGFGNLNNSFKDYLVNNNFSINAICKHTTYDYKLPQSDIQQLTIKELVHSNKNGRLYTEGNIDEALNDILSKYINTSNCKPNYLVLNEDILNYVKSYSDYEDDTSNINIPYAERWEIAQDKDYFETPLGYMDNIIPMADYENGTHKWGDFIQDPINTMTLSKPGRYIISHQEQDNPSKDKKSPDGSNTKTEDFNGYNETNVDREENRLEIFINRRPISKFTYTIGNNKEITLINKSYDVDHISKSNKGIIKSVWKWKKINEACWHLGTPPKILDNKTIYLVTLTVKDEDGFYSKPYTDIIDTTVPSIIINPISKSWLNTKLKLSITTYDNSDKGLNNLRYIVTNTSLFPTQTWTTKTYSEFTSKDITEVMLDKEGQWYLHATACDNNSGQTYSYGGVYQLDFTAPVININSQSGAIPKGFLLSLNTNDLLSGVTDVWYKWSNTNANINDLTEFCRLPNTLNNSISSPTIEGTYYLHVKCKDKANNISYKIFGTYKVDDLTVKAAININPVKQGQKIIFTVDTTGYAKYLTLDFPSEIKFLDFKLPITIQIPEKSIHTEYIPYYLPLKTPLTIDKNNRRLRLPYKVTVTAKKSDGTTKTDIVSFDVKGNILDGIKTEINKN